MSWRCWNMKCDTQYCFWNVTWTLFFQPPSFHKYSLAAMSGSVMWVPVYLAGNQTFMWIFGTERTGGVCGSVYDICIWSHHVWPHTCTQRPMRKGGYLWRPPEEDPVCRLQWQKRNRWHLFPETFTVSHLIQSTV